MGKGQGFVLDVAWGISCGGWGGGVRFRFRFGVSGVIPTLFEVSSTKFEEFWLRSLDNTTSTLSPKP